jgi:hypothetical protein
MRGKEAAAPGVRASARGRRRVVSTSPAAVPATATLAGGATGSNNDPVMFNTLSPPLVSPMHSCSVESVPSVYAVGLERQPVAAGSLVCSAVESGARGMRPDVDVRCRASVAKAAASTGGGNNNDTVVMSSSALPTTSALPQHSSLVGNASPPCPVGDGGARRGTTLMTRALLNPLPGVAAPYVGRDGDGPMVAPLRARIRLCCTALAEHRELRHQPADRDGNGRRCRACNTGDATAEHVLMQCTAFAAERAACETAMRAEGLRLELGAIGGVAPTGTSVERWVAMLRATAGLLLAIRARMRI